MRILYLTHQYYPDCVGGTELVVRGLVRRMREKGHVPAVFSFRSTHATNHSAYGIKRERVEDADVYWFEFNLSQHPNIWEAEYHNRFANYALRAVLREFRPDVAHVMHGMKIGGGIYRELHNAGVPIVTVFTDYWFFCLRHTLLLPDGAPCISGPEPQERCLDCLLDIHRVPAEMQAGAKEALAKRNIFLREVLALSSRLIALCEHSARMHERFGIIGIRVEAHGVETAILESALAHRQAHPERQPGAPLRLLYVGSMVYHKGGHLVIQAIAESSDLPIEFRIVTNVSTMSAYMEKWMGVGDRRIDWAGPCLPEKIGQHYEWCDALVVPSIWNENALLTFKDALYCGIPVAAHDLPGLFTHPIGDGWGWKIPTPSVSAWKDWLRDAVEMKTRYMRLDIHVPTADEFAERMFFHYKEVLHTVKD